MQTLKSYSIHLKSLSPFIMNRDTLANPLHPMKKKLSELTGLKVKQDEHHMAIAKLQWNACLYYEDDIGVFLSSKMITGCFRASARKERKGLLMKAVIIDCFPGTPLLPYVDMTPEKLWDITNKKGSRIHCFEEALNIQNKKTMKTRPIFHEWEVKFNILLNTEILSESDLKRIIERAGFEYGFGELRPEMANGVCGRFSLEDMKVI